MTFQQRKRTSDELGGITPNMGLQNPDIGKTDGNLKDRFADGEPFTLKAAEVIENVKTDYGTGTMVVLTVETPEGDKRLSVWGSYLVAQARAAEPSDFGKRYTIARGPVDGFSDNPDTKRLQPVDA